MIVSEIFVSDIASAHDFYCRKLPFHCLSLVRPAPDDKGFMIVGDNKIGNYRIRIGRPRNLDLLNLLNQERGARIHFRKAKIAPIHQHVKRHLPELSIISDSWGELPDGHFAGPYGFPGGPALYVRDPFGNFLLFSEW